jgi:hypothetical protein
LRVAKAGRRRVTTRTRVIIVEADKRIVKEIATQIGKPCIDLSPQAFFQRPLDLSCKAVALQHG